MTKAECYFVEIAESIPTSTMGNMLGSLCVKNAKGVSFAMMWQNELVVKLDKNEIVNVQKLKGTKLFEPKEGKPMKEWMQIPFLYSKQWKTLTEKSFDLVALKN